jgi:glycosyltransferase 2 family protein
MPAVLTFPPGLETVNVNQESSPQPSNSKRRTLFFFLKFGISLMLLGYVVWKAGLNSAEGREVLLHTLKNVNGFYFILSLICGLVLTVISSWKWKVLLHCRNIEVPFIRLLALYFIGRFFNLFLPTSMGGDVVRVWELGRQSGKKYEALASVFVERLSGMVTLALLSIVAVLVELHTFDLPILTASLLFLSGLILLIFWIILDQRPLAFFSRTLGDRVALLQKFFIKLHRSQEAVLEYKDNPLALLKVFVISCLFYFMAVVNVWITALTFFPEVSFDSMLLAVPAIMLVMNLPISIGGIGLMEAAFALLFPLFGYTTALALSTALLMRFQTIFYGIAGGIIHLGRLRVEPVEQQIKS